MNAWGGRWGLSIAKHGIKILIALAFFTNNWPHRKRKRSMKRPGRVLYIGEQIPWS